MTRSNHPPKKLVFFLALFLLFFCGILFFPGAAFRGAEKLARPVWMLGNVTRVAGFTSFLSEMWGDKAALVRKNQSLEAQVKELQVAKMQRDELLGENQSLRQILNRKGSRDLILAGILAKPPISAYDTFVVDAGSAEGVQNGAKVFMYGNIAIGTVFEVAAHTSKVQLYSSPGSQTHAFLGDQHLPITLTGAGAGNFQAEIPRGVQVPIGTEIFLPGIEGDILGTVEHVEQEENDTFQELYAKSAVDIWTLPYVQIEKE
ncbi:MAG TPA: rod shape-determining protein MreC [Candidatus Paceibacterota bacterium]|nr:rod shape-determining protein MreC [Candidatus Paceibacterota bacterium]